MLFFKTYFVVVCSPSQVVEEFIEEWIPKGVKVHWDKVHI